MLLLSPGQLLLCDGCARERHVLAQSYCFPLEQDANRGAFGPPESALHLLARDKLHAHKVNFKNGIAHADEPTARRSPRRLKSRDLVEAVLAANELHADATGWALGGCFHRR